MDNLGPFRGPEMNTGMIRVGSGTYGTVVELNHQKHGKVVSKRIDITDGYSHPLELDIMIRFNHPNLMRCIEYHPITEGNKKYISIIMDKASKDLYTYRSRTIINYDQVIDIFHQCLSGLRALHDEDILHLDIKPNNIVIFEEQKNRIKLIDFGMAKKIYSGSDCSRYGKIIGNYIPPENINGGLVYGKYTDVWTMGMTFLYILTGTITTTQSIIHNKTKIIEDAVRFYSNKDLLTELLNSMLSLRSSSRPSCADLLELSIFSKYLYIPNKIIDYSIQYGTYRTSEADMILFDNFFSYLASKRCKYRTVCNAIDIYHRYMKMAEENSEEFNRNKGYTLTASTYISFLMNEDKKMDYKDIYLNLTGYHTSIELEYRELPDHIISVNMFCQYNISNSPLFNYVNDNDKFSDVICYTYDPVEYAKIVQNSPTDNEVKPSYSSTMNSFQPIKCK